MDRGGRRARFCEQKGAEKLLLAEIALIGPSHAGGRRFELTLFRNADLQIQSIFSNSINKASNGTGSSSKTVTKGSTVPLFMPVCANQHPLQNRVQGNACDRRRWRIKGARVGAAVEIGSTDRRARRFWAPQEGLQRNFEPFCPCHRRRGLCIVRDDFSVEKSSARSRRRSSSPPKSLRLFGDPINFGSTMRFEPFFLCFLRLAHGLIFPVSERKTGVIFASGGNRL